MILYDTLGRIAASVRQHKGKFYYLRNKWYANLDRHKFSILEVNLSINSRLVIGRSILDKFLHFKPVLSAQLDLSELNLGRR